MYADDTTVFVRDTDSIIHLLNPLQRFEVCSVLEINTSKTEAMWLGCWKNRPDTPFGFKWPQEPIPALGVFFSYDTTKANELNFKNKMCGIEKILNIKKFRKLTLMGKINIVKTLASAKPIYNTSVLNFPKHLITQVNDI